MLEEEQALGIDKIKKNQLKLDIDNSIGEMARSVITMKEKLSDRKNQGEEDKGKNRNYKNAEKRKRIGKEACRKAREEGEEGSKADEEYYCRDICWKREKNISKQRQ